MWKRHGKNNIYLIKSHNTVVATFQIKKIEGELHLEKLAIIPKYQGKGIGTYCIDAIEKVVDNPPQKMQQNRFHKCQNLDGAFVITPPLMPGPALLVDDIVDSAWTLTVLTALLRQAGCPTVYPLALASTSVKN